MTQVVDEHRDVIAPLRLEHSPQAGTTPAPRARGRGARASRSASSGTRPRPSRSPDSIAYGSRRAAVSMMTAGPPPRRARSLRRTSTPSIPGIDTSSRTSSGSRSSTIRSASSPGAPSARGGRRRSGALRRGRACRESRRRSERRRRLDEAACGQRCTRRVHESARCSRSAAARRVRGRLDREQRRYRGKTSVNVEPSPSSTDLDLPAERAREPARERKADPGPGVISPVAGVELVESRKSSPSRGRNPDARVAHREAHLVLRAPHGR